MKKAKRKILEAHTRDFVGLYTRWRKGFGKEETFEELKEAAKQLEVTLGEVFIDDVKR